MKISNDERTVQISSRINSLWLGFTQLGLASIVLYRGYVLDQPIRQFADLLILLVLSLLGHLFSLMYFGGFFLILKPKQLKRIYVGVVIFLAIGFSFWKGVPKLSEWKTTFLPVALGPAIILGLYYSLAKWGEERIDK
jgi:hypothetical protein